MFSTILSIKTTEKNDDCERRFELSYVFVISKVRMHSYVSYSQSLESIKNFSLQYSLRYLRTFERVVIALGLFRSSLFISGLTLFGLLNHQLWGESIRSCFLRVMSFKNKTSSFSIVCFFKIKL